MASWGLITSRILLSNFENCNWKYVYTREKSALTILRNHIMRLCNRVNVLSETQQLDKENFLSGLVDMKLHVDLVWIVIHCSVINYMEYVQCLLNYENTSKELGESLAELCCVANDELIFEKQVFADMMRFLDSFEVQQLRTCLTSLTAGTYYRIRSGSTGLAMNLLAKTLSELKPELKEEIYLKFLNLFTVDRGINIKVVLGNAQLYQPQCDSQYEPLCLAIVGGLDCERTAHQLTEIILECCDCGRDLNWNHVSTFLCYSIKSSSFFFTQLKTLVNSILEKGLMEFGRSYLYAALLIGRIISLDKVAAGVTYLQWYSSTFSSESHRPLNSVTRAKFFFTSMIEILDVEPPHYLKVHMHKAPSVPASCQGDLAEYLQLAKARLISMNESIDMGFFENVSGCQTSENDVACVVKQFETTGKIASKILAALTFRRHYFENSFLPKLLSSCPGQLSPHHNVIKKLHDLGKMSNALFNKHKDSCRR